MRSLRDGTVDALEDRREEVHLDDGVVDFVDADAVADVVRVLDEEEDDRGEDLLGGRTDEPREAEDEGAGAETGRVSAHPNGEAEIRDAYPVIMVWNEALRKPSMIRMATTHQTEMRMLSRRLTAESMSRMLRARAIRSR